MFVFVCSIFRLPQLFSTLIFETRPTSRFGAYCFGWLTNELLASARLSYSSAGAADAHCLAFHQTSCLCSRHSPAEAPAHTQKRVLYHVYLIPSQPSDKKSKFHISEFTLIVLISKINGPITTKLKLLKKL